VWEEKILWLQQLLCHFRVVDDRPERVQADDLAQARQLAERNDYFEKKLPGRVGDAIEEDKLAQRRQWNLA
jgi:hypothetical protein